MIVRDVSSAPARSQTVARDMNYQGATSLAATRSKTSREDPNDARSVNNAVDNAVNNAPLFKGTGTQPYRCYFLRDFTNNKTHHPTGPTTDDRLQLRSPSCRAVGRQQSLRPTLPP
jgi:hypothetical protein